MHRVCLDLPAPPPLDVPYLPYALPGTSPTQSQQCLENPGSSPQSRGYSMRLP